MQNKKLCVLLQQFYSTFYIPPAINPIIKNNVAVPIIVSIPKRYSNFDGSMPDIILKIAPQ